MVGVGADGVIVLKTMPAISRYDEAPESRALRIYASMAITLKALEGDLAMLGTHPTKAGIPAVLTDP